MYENVIGYKTIKYFLCDTMPIIVQKETRAVRNPTFSS